jgi:predicted MPP superfamily phosphohydrolase
MSAITNSPLRRPGDTSSRRFDPSKVRYSPRWLAAGFGLGSLAALALTRGNPLTLAALGGLGLAGAGYTLLVEPQLPQLTRLTLRSPRVPPELDGLRIGHLSDLHLGHRYADENSSWAVAQMVATQPDLLVITGDFVSFAHAIPRLPRLLSPLRAPLGIFAVPGNHDYWEGVNRIQESLAPLGIEFLFNQQRQLDWNGATLTVAGIDDLWYGQPDLPAALATERPNDFTLLLSHAPDIADEADDFGVDLQLSGHTHGGHLCLPVLGSFALPKYGQRYAAGYFQLQRTQIYVNRGISGLPIRMGCRPEVALITLKHDQPA